MATYVFVPPSWSDVSNIITAIGTALSVGIAAYAIRQAHQMQVLARGERDAEAA